LRQNGEEGEEKKVFRHWRRAPPIGKCQKLWMSWKRPQLTGKVKLHYLNRRAQVVNVGAEDHWIESRHEFGAFAKMNKSHPIKCALIHFLHLTSP
jgi:hypothetical protein